MTHSLLTDRRLRPAAAAAALSALLCAGAVLAPGSADAAVMQHRSTAFSGTSRVGALFSTSHGRLASHFCTASVVDSRSRDLLVTAAHCVVAPGSGRATNGLVFIPGYHAGQEPYGRWAVRKAIVDYRWSAHGDPDHDVAFLTTAPVGRGGRVQDAVGAEAIAFNRAVRDRAVAIGYPVGSGRPVRCGSRLRRFTGSQVEFDCRGLPGGTSGGPLLTGAGPTGAGRGTVVGVIGGYQSGGATADVSYSSYFGRDIAAVYRTALGQG
jgi:V8-like Glu-specific endopeptidase